MCEAFAALPALVHIVAGFRVVTQAALARMLTSMPARLTFLKLSFVKRYQEGGECGAEGAGALAAALQRLASLHTLKLHACYFVNTHTAALAPAIGSLTRLRWLELRACAITSTSACALAPHLARLQWLTHFAIGDIAESLGVEGARALALTLALLPRLQRLDLRDLDTMSNSLSHEAGAELQAALQVNFGVEVRVVGKPRA